MTPTPSIVHSTVTITTTLLSRENKKRGIPELGELHNMRHIYGPVHALQVLPGNALRKRQTTVSPTAIPSYASPCSSLAAYSSACSCLGVPRTTVTAAAAASTSMYTITETYTPSLPTRVVNTTSGSPSTTNATGTARPTLSNNSTGLFTNTSTPTSSPTRIIDTTCGQSSTPFSLRVSQPDGLFDGWYARLSGDGVLFTSVQSSATPFSVESSGHLCAVGYEGEFGNAVIAVVTNLTASGAVWLLDGRRAQALGEDYVPLECTTGGGAGLSCAAGETKNWVGCGLQLDLSSEPGNVVVDGFNCSAINLVVG